MGQYGLRTRFRRAGDTGVVELDGDLDIATASVLAAALAEGLGDIPRVRRMVVDLDGVRFCGVRGLTTLLDAADRGAADGVRVVLARRPPHVGRLMALVGVPGRPHPLLAYPDAVELLPRPGVPGPSPALR